MTDWGQSGRKDTFEYVTVDPFTLKTTGDTVEAESGGSITYGYYTDNLYSASLPLIGSVSNKVMVRVIHHIEMPSGESVEESLGTFFIVNDTGDALYGRVERSLSGYSSLIRFTEDILTEDFSRKKGYVVTDEVEELVTANGGLIKFGADVDMTKKHTQNICFEMGTTQSEVLNTIADWTGCQMGVDGDGYVTWNKYYAPGEKSISYDFEEGANCIYKAGYTWTQENDDRVNCVFAHYSRESKDDDDDYPLSMHVRVTLPETHSFSYQNIGRRITYDLDVSDPCSKSELTSQAQSYLDGNCGAINYYEIEHPSIPGLEVGDVVTYTNSTDGSGVEEKCMITQIDMTLSAGCMCKTKMKAIS